MQQFDLSGSRALVTGASRGIGRVLAVGLAAAGADVFVTARTEDALRSVVEEIEQLGRRAAYAAIDISNVDAAVSLVDAAQGSLGGLEILVNNAAIDTELPAFDLTVETFHDINWVNVTVPWALCREAGRRFVDQGGGTIVNVASVYGLVGGRNDSAYIASKHGLVGLTKALAVEWARKGVRVNAVAPGFVVTEMTRSSWEEEAAMKWVLSRTPLGRPGEPEDIVGPVIFLASEASAFVTGHVLVADGGWTIE